MTQSMLSTIENGASTVLVRRILELARALDSQLTAG